MKKKTENVGVDTRERKWMELKHLSILLWIGVLAILFSGCQIAHTLPGVPPIDGEPSEDTSSRFGSLAGIVVDSASNLKILQGTARIGGQSVEIRQGHFEVENLPYGTHEILITAPFYKETRVPMVMTQNAQLTTIKVQTIYNAADLDLFARMVSAESQGEPYRGQVAVAASILNRIRHRNYPNTLWGVLYQRTASGHAQYSPIDNGAIHRPATAQSRLAVYDALAGWDPSLGATGFFAPAKVLNRNNWVWQQIPIIDIGNHRFFRARID